MKKIITFLLFLTISFCGSYFYRPYIYSNHIYDWHLADCFPSFMSVPVTYLFYLIMKELFKLQRKNPFYELIVIIFGGLVYECIQLLGYGFDWYDIIATIIGGLVVSIYLFIQKKHSQALLI